MYIIYIHYVNTQFRIRVVFVRVRNRNMSTESAAVVFRGDVHVCWCRHIDRMRVGDVSTPGTRIFDIRRDGHIQFGIVVRATGVTGLA